MLTNFCIIHRRKPRFFQEAGAPVWATCLRSLAFVKSPGEVVTEAHDEIYAGPKAYVFLLEIICGLHSPIVGETEVFGQFKNFVSHWLAHQPEHAGLAQKVLADAKALRSRHLSRLGNQSYGSWLRKNVKTDEVHILGGGHLVREILPYLTKQGKKVTVHVRDPRKIDFHAGPVQDIRARKFTGGALIVAAPMSAAEIGAWLGTKRPEQTFDLRDNSCTDKVAQAHEQYGLKAIFKQIEENKTKLLPVVEKVRSEISALTTKICSQALVRPQGVGRPMRLKLASRKSDLARWQAVQVAHALELIPEKPGIEFIFKSSFGDQNLDIPLAGMGARGVFTEDFYKDLTEGRCDLVVHSWKDLPVEERADTRVAMTMKRADVRDLILIPEEIWTEARQAGKLTVLTSSPRRVYNLSGVLNKLLPGNLEIEFRNVRGNVPTRLRKMREEKSALILAKAGLDRLLEAEAEGFLPIGESVRALIENCRFQIFPVSLNPPAPAQGALAVEIAAAHPEMTAICAKLNNEVTYNCVQMEREILKHYGGGCHQKIGVARLPRDYGLVCGLKGVTDAGEVLNEWRIDNATSWAKARNPENVFPLEARDNSWFQREPVSPDSSIQNFSALLVARADAWPKSYQPPKNQLIWTAGVQTWMKLAEQGAFVSGCQDGLGENEEKHLDRLAGPQTWCKLTHEGALEGAGDAVATYRLKAKSSMPDLSGKTHFFWMSRSSFERAYAAFPKEIGEGHNACGPGLTYEFLKSFKGLKHPVKVFAGLKQYLDESLP